MWGQNGTSALQSSCPVFVSNASTRSLLTSCATPDSVLISETRSRVFARSASFGAGTTTKRTDINWRLQRGLPDSTSTDDKRSVPTELVMKYELPSATT